MDTARTAFANLPPPAETLAILLGCTQLTLFGLGGIANPIDWSRGYGLPIIRALELRRRKPAAAATAAADHDAAGEAEKTQIALVAALAARNVRHAVLVLALACWARDRRAVGVALIANCISSLADTLIVRWFGNSQQTALHVGGMLSSLTLGTVLLRWRREDAWW